ncbi:MAG TPA: hypothetical protein VEH30_15445 [Terriglobales bacterium]|nr:hypothetical protein [Terriglobales bacterium]
MIHKFAGRADFSVASVILFLVLISASPLRAQEAARVDAFGGFSYMRFNALTIGYPNDTNLYGFNAEGTFNIKLWLAVTANVSGNYGSQMSSYHFMIGPQYTWRRDTSNIFVHGLFGKAQNNVSIVQPTRSGFESVGRSFGAGFGYDHDWRDRFSIRVLQIDVFHSDTFKKSQNDARVSTGLVFHFGHIGHHRKL